MEKKDRKNIIGNIIKWVIILVVLVLVYFWKQEEIHDAINEMKHHPFWVSLLCLAATLLHFVVEGRIIHDMTMYEKRQMTWFEAFKCGLYCAFYKLISLGSLSGIAEVYYIARHDIEPGRSSGITLVQYAYQKLGITILGILSFIYLYISGVPTVIKCAKFGVLGSFISFTIVALLLTLSASTRFAGLLIKIVRFFEKRLLAKYKEKLEELIEQITTFNEAGLYFWRHKTLCLRVTLLKMLKMSLWYSIAAIVVCATNDASPLTCIALMATVNMIGTVMAAPAGAGTLEFVIALIFTPLFGNTSAAVAILYRFYTMVVPFLLGSIVFATTGKMKNTSKTDEGIAQETNG